MKVLASGCVCLKVCIGGAPREKIFTFEKTNSFKRGGVRDGFGGLVTIITGVGCFGAQVGVCFFKSKNFFLRVGGVF